MYNNVPVRQYSSSTGLPYNFATYIQYCNITNQGSSTI
jgi:hypothetical protein